MLSEPPVRQRAGIGALPCGSRAEQALLEMMASARELAPSQALELASWLLVLALENQDLAEAESPEAVAQAIKAWCLLADAGF